MSTRAGHDRAVAERQHRVTVRNRAEAGDVEPVGNLVGQVQEQARLMVDGDPRRPRNLTRGPVLDGDLVNDLLVVQRDDELVGLDGVGVVDAPVRNSLVHEGEVQFLVELVEQ